MHHGCCCKLFFNYLGAYYYWYLVSWSRDATCLAWLAAKDKWIRMENEKETGKTECVPRRSFLNWAWLAFAALACVEFGWIVKSILKSPKTREKQDSGSIIDAGMMSDFKPGSVKAIPQGQFYLACLDDGSFLALSRTCTHLGCSVPWNDKEGKFICPCHGSTFDAAGTVLTAPALRPLDYFPIRLENGLIRVDISRSIKRESFDSSQTVKI